jgi:hypothetical protein
LIFSQTVAARIDKETVSATFLENAARLFEAAQAVSRVEPDAAGGDEANLPQSDWDVLVGEDGSIRMIAGSDWSLDSLQVHHGARMAYRVRRLGMNVRLEGRAGSRTCLFEAATPDGAARLLLAERQLFSRAVLERAAGAGAASMIALASGAATPGLLRANTQPLLPAA